MSRAWILVPLVALVLVGLFFVLRPDPPAEDEEEEVYEIETIEDVEILEGAMYPEEITVDEGDRVTLLLTSDSPVEFHVHGYDLTAEVEPDEPAELSFDAAITGRFEIENHASDEALGELLVQPG